MEPSTSAAEAAARIVPLILFAVLVSGVFYAAHSYLLGRIFVKAGEEHWKAWVPVVNTWTTFKLGGFAGALSLLAFIPLANIASAIIGIIAAHRINVGFGKDAVYTVVYFLMPFVWLCMMAFGNITWRGINQPQPQYPHYPHQQPQHAQQYPQQPNR